ncbi:hypothetical protein HPB51_019723 [Rhipicephalus microplus]|uniref:Uncharacterized protein n=1 Tax=Rhipicephalus microplus TaxID=6941 RepID=A0A9J6F5E0_RHIMP|nr:hypothetical protein HPB51_019723 [Rhipicephalus microplus]
MPNWAIQQYHVEFAPNIESSRLRSALLRDHRDRFGGSYIFDGMSDLKSATRLEHKVTELYSQRRTDGAQIRITVKHVQELAPHNPELLRIFNTQMRRSGASSSMLLVRSQSAVMGDVSIPNSLDSFRGNFQFEQILDSTQQSSEGNAVDDR